MIPNKPIRFSRIRGMCNTNHLSIGGDEKGVYLKPYIIFNADVNRDETVTIRKGKNKFMDLPRAHSLFSDGQYLFCVAAGSVSGESIWRIDTDSKKKFEIGSITGGYSPLYYVKIKDVLYMSSKFWCGKYLYKEDRLARWGSYSGVDIKDRPYKGNSSHYILADVEPARPMEFLCHFGSIIYGAIENYIVYSVPFAYDWFKATNKIFFPSKIVMIAKAETGLYVASEDETWFLHGRIPSKMVKSKVGNGAVKGTMQYISYTDIGNNIPIWVSPSGIVAGTHQGKIVNLTENKIKFDVGVNGASLSYMYNNEPKYLASFTLPKDVVLGDSATVEVFRNGKFLN